MAPKKQVKCVAQKGCYDDKKQFRNPSQENEKAKDCRFFSCSVDRFKALEKAGCVISLERFNVMNGAEPAAEKAVSSDDGGQAAVELKTAQDEIVVLNNTLTERDDHLAQAKQTFDEQAGTIMTHEQSIADLKKEVKDLKAAAAK